MTGAVYQCCDERRRTALAALTPPKDISGIDYIEVTQGNPISVATTIDIFLVKPLPMPLATLTAANLAITGGVRFSAPVVDTVTALPPAGATISSYRVKLKPTQPTDFSTYTLAILANPGASEPPVFIDPRLSSVAFSFKVDCPADFDCAPDRDPPPTASGPEREFDYRARDWDGFRRLMLDRMSELVPDFREDDPVDLTTTLIEALAYRADQQSYRIDWVATEAFLGTARSRTSVARHARLVDYAPGEGASARAFVGFDFAPGNGHPDGPILPRGTPLLPKVADQPVVLSAPAYARLLSPGAVVFETLAPLRLWQWRNAIAFHSWSDDLCCLPLGATAATLVDLSVGDPDAALKAGDFVLLRQTASPTTGLSDDADPMLRHVVRLTSVVEVNDILFAGLKLVDVTWSVADAIPFDLVIEAEVAQASGPALRVVCADAAANVTLADHGASLPPAPHLGLTPSDTAALTPRLDPAAPLAEQAWRPVVRAGIGPLARVADHSPAQIPALSAKELTSVDPAACLPAVTLQDAFAIWHARRDLLVSGRFSRDFVVETGPLGDPVLRFGDGQNGLSPQTGAALALLGRFGKGVGGNLGADALGHVVVSAPLEGLLITRATNPVLATGGATEEQVAAIRVAAPQAFRIQDRAVTAADYAAAALRFPGVAGALAVPRWTGSWQSMIIYIDRAGGLAIDAAFQRVLLTHIDHFRLAGFDFALRPTQPAPLDIALSVCAAPGQIRASVGQRLRAALQPFGPRDGSRGFFHPDNFTFGTPLYLSQLVAAAMAVEGVQSVTVTRFQRFARLAQNELALGVLRPVGSEILELRDDPSFPERGRLALDLGGGI